MRPTVVSSILAVLVGVAALAVAFAISVPAGPPPVRPIVLEPAAKTTSTSSTTTSSTTTIAPESTTTTLVRNRPVPSVPTDYIVVDCGRFTLTRPGGSAPTTAPPDPNATVAPDVPVAAGDDPSITVNIPAAPLQIAGT
jgi:hypothetical protein